MQTRQANSSKPHKRNGGSFTQSTSASLNSNSGSFARSSSGSFQKHNSASFPKTNSGSFRRTDSIPLAENPYARSSSAIYTGGERAIFRNQETSRRNRVILRIMIGLCILMIAVLIGFALGKGAGLAEADTSVTSQGIAAPLVQTSDSGEGTEVAPA